MEHLIVKYLQNSLSPREAEELKKWIEEKPLNSKVFENIVGEWNLSSTEVNQSKDLIRRKILADETIINHNDSPVKEKPKSDHVFSFRSVLRYAAMVIVTIGIVFAIYQFQNDQESTHAEVEQKIFIEKETAPGQRITFELPDGSIVKLNAGSKLFFPTSFHEGYREVKLIGEAFFDIKRDEERPFRIHTSNVSVKVLGTSFNVKSYPGEDITEVGVKSGKVSVSASKGKSVILGSNDLLEYVVSTGDLNQARIEDMDLIFGWIDQVMVINEQSIHQILRRLEKWYNVEFVLQKKLDEKKKFTAKYIKPSMEAVLESLAYGFDFNYEINENKIIIK
ncbi:MAG: FecR family protein [Cyclobacteriaceae bacterium]|nr:FecR family protein [Cyclobacteriaceae bacterium SS2]